MADAQVVAICDVDEGRARTRAKAFSIPKVYTDFRAMIGQEKLDAVDIVTPVGKNYQVCFSSAVREFVHGIRSGNPFPTDRLDNLETLKLMESCYVAAGVKF